MLPAARQERALYSYHRALEELEQERGLLPRRLFTQLFPIYQVTVRGKGRRADDFEELEWFMIRAIGQGRVQTIPELCRFFGLDEIMVRQVVGVLQLIGHLTEDPGGVFDLTQLGREALQDERRYEEYESRQLLYFDAFTCQPLPRSYYRLTFLPPGGLPERERALFSFAPWRPEALAALARRSDRADFNVPDEVHTLEYIEHTTIYLPLHIVEARTPAGPLELRVLSNVRGKRDHFFEQLLAQYPAIVAPLLNDPRPPKEVIPYGLENRNLSPGDYDLELPADREWRVVISPRWLTKRAEGTRRLPELGEYLLAADYCLRLWTDYEDGRQSAARDKILEKLEKLPREMSPAEVNQRIRRICATLEVPVPDLAELIVTAQRRGMERASDRLGRQRS